MSFFKQCDGKKRTLSGVRRKVNGIMAKKREANAYGTLIRIMIVLFVLVLLCGAGYILMDQSIKAQEEENLARAQAENDQLETQYQQAKAEEEEQARTEEEQARQWPLPQPTGWDVVDLTDYPVQNPTTVSVSRQEMLLGGMMLLNHWHSQPEDFPESEIKPVYQESKKIPVKDSSVRLFPVAISALEQLIQAAKDAGYEGYVINEGFRDNSKQDEYYQKEAEKYANTLFGDALVEKVRQSVNVPGTSEYQSGFSFMVDRYLKGDPIMDYKFQDLAMSDWLLEHSWEYGIIFRFPVQNYPNRTVMDKSYKTGESKKLSIYRYVGQANAAAMHTLGFCMEEYIEYLMAHPHIGIYENGELRYEIIRQTIGANTGSVTVTISRDAMGSYTASIDNMTGELAGVIVAMSY